MEEAKEPPRMRCQYLLALSAYLYRVDVGVCSVCFTPRGERWRDGTMVEKWDAQTCSCPRCLEVETGADIEVLGGAPRYPAVVTSGSEGAVSEGRGSEDVHPAARGCSRVTELALTLSLASRRVSIDTGTWAMGQGEKLAGGRRLTKWWIDEGRMPTCRDIPRLVETEPREARGMPGPVGRSEGGAAVKGGEPELALRGGSSLRAEAEPFSSVGRCPPLVTSREPPFLPPWGSFPTRGYRPELESDSDTTEDAEEQGVALAPGERIPDARQCEEVVNTEASVAVTPCAEARGVGAVTPGEAPGQKLPTGADGRRPADERIPEGR